MPHWTDNAAPGPCAGQRRAEGRRPNRRAPTSGASPSKASAASGPRTLTSARPRPHARRRAQRLRQVQLRRSPGGAAHRRQQALGRTAPASGRTAGAASIVRTPAPCRRSLPWKARHGHRRAQWADDAALDDSSAWFQPKGGARKPYEELGWHTAIRTHRPLLPYSELGAVFDKPSEIHDALVEVLGLGEFDAVQKTLQTARKIARGDSDHRQRTTRQSILPRLRAIAESSGDARAEAARQGACREEARPRCAERACWKPAPANRWMRASRCCGRRRCTPRRPSREAVAAAARELREAVAAVEQSRGTDAGRARALAQLLDQALRYHAAHATSDCPVCGTAGALGATWREDTAAALADLKSRADAADRAHTRLDGATTAATGCCECRRRHIEPLGEMGLASARPALKRSSEWGSGASIADPLALAAHLERRVDGLRRRAGPTAR